MAKKKKDNVTITHAEVIGFAISAVAARWDETVESAKAIEAKDPEFAKKMLDDCMWKDKLKALLQLYKIEHGEDYGYEFNLD